MEALVGDLEIDLLRCFVAATTTGSFTEAGRQIGLSQSAASLRLKRLEERLGSPLLRRTSRRLELTSFGEVFLRDAVELLDVHDRIVKRHAAADLERARVGIDETIPEFLYPALFSAFDALSLGQPSFRTQTTHETAQQVDRGELELGLVWSTRSCPWGGRAIFESQVVWAAHENMPVHALDPIPVVHHTACEFTINALQMARTPYAIVFESSNLHACHQAVERGLGVAPTSLLALQALGECRRLDDPRLLGAEVVLRLIFDATCALPVGDLAALLIDRLSTIAGPKPLGEGLHLVAE